VREFERVRGIAGRQAIESECERGLASLRASECERVFASSSEFEGVRANRWTSEGERV